MRSSDNDNEKNNNSPSILARYTTASIFVVILSTWTRLAFPPRADTPGLTSPMHGPSSPVLLTAMYLISLPLLRSFTERYLSPRYDMKVLLTESMILYNVVQVFLNGWMVYAMIDAVLYNGHPFIGSRGLSGVAINSGASYAVYVHYCDKYLEFLDTYFMILRGKMDQVSVAWSGSGRWRFSISLSSLPPTPPPTSPLRGWWLSPCASFGERRQFFFEMTKT